MTNVSFYYDFVFCTANYIIIYSRDLFLLYLVNFPWIHALIKLVFSLEIQLNFSHIKLKNVFL